MLYILYHILIFTLFKSGQVKILVILDFGISRNRRYLAEKINLKIFLLFFTNINAEKFHCFSCKKPHFFTFSDSGSQITYIKYRNFLSASLFLIITASLSVRTGSIFFISNNPPLPRPPPSHIPESSNHALLFSLSKSSSEE